jgi:hypothetical protein
MSIAQDTEQTPEQAWLADERALLIMLQKLASYDQGRTTFDDLWRAVEEQMNGVDLSAAGRERLHTLLRRDGIAEGFVLVPPEHSDVWELAPRGREHLQRSATAAEDTAGPDDDITIMRPFDPSLIRVDMTQMPVFQVMRKIDMGEIWLQPDFQRNLVWDNLRKSRLIESILLRIPLPAFYLDAARDDRWQVVDGLQRLSTMHGFYKSNFALTGLQYLTDLNHRSYNQLPRNLQRVIEDHTRLTLYIIQPDTPRDVKFMIFSRVNTGGLPLTAQEIRHALYEGTARTLLKELAESQAFLQATTWSVSSLRMDDRECVLRYLAFSFFPYQDFGRTQEGAAPNLETLLNQTMERLNKLSPAEVDAVRERFAASMNKARRVFGSYAFRKLYARGGKRYPVSKPLFEAWGVLLEHYSEAQIATAADAIMDRFIQVMNTDQEFVTAISYGTGSRGTIHKRFSTIEALLREVVV